MNSATIALHESALAILKFCALASLAQTAPVANEHFTLLKAGKLLDVRKGAYIDNAAILIEDDLIKEVGRGPMLKRTRPRTQKSSI